MRKLSLTAAVAGLLTLAFAFGFAQSSHAAAADAPADVATLTAGVDLADGALDGARPRRFLLRAAHSMVRAVRTNCDCGDVECARAALAEQQAKILAHLPERCGEDCQARVEQALGKIATRILARVENASCEPRDPNQP